jgi:hypothetical protein
LLDENNAKWEVSISPFLCISVFTRYLFTHIWLYNWFLCAILRKTWARIGALWCHGHERATEWVSECVVCSVCSQLTVNWFGLLYFFYYSFWICHCVMPQRIHHNFINFINSINFVLDTRYFELILSAANDIFVCVCVCMHA